MIKIFSMIIRSAIFLTILPFIVVLLISFTEDTSISPYLKWWMIIIPAVPLWFLCFKSISINKDVRKGHIGKVNLNEIPKLLVLNDPKDNEAIRVIKEMPKWTPGKHEGKKVSVKYTIPINFALKG